jgi:hypothetical protein
VFADILHANNVLAHVPDLNDFMAGIVEILKPCGRALIEVPYVRELIGRLEFDTIYHEHLCYFSLTALESLFYTVGLQVVDVEQLPIHGGSLRLHVEHGGRPSQNVTRLHQAERAEGIADAAFYRDFGLRVNALRMKLRALLGSLKADGASIAAYGASAKGCTLLHYCGIGAETIDFVVDRSTVKQGHYTPGTHLPILPPETLTERKPEYVLLLSWNFADEILAQQEAYRKVGGLFIIPIPDPVVI